VLDRETEEAAVSDLDTAVLDLNCVIEGLNGSVVRIYDDDSREIRQVVDPKLGL